MTKVFSKNCCEMKKLKIKAEQIIEKCEHYLKDKANEDYEVIGVILREFNEILNFINEEDKVPVLTKRKDLWSTRTIVDSANTNLDLFEMVYDFERFCKKLDNGYIKIQYNLK